MDDVQKWYFTFGFGHAYPNCFVVIEGTFHSSREEMVRRYNDKWAFQYDKGGWFNENGQSQQERWDLTEVE